MSIVVVGSLNIDSTYTLPHIPKEGETILALSKSMDRGGKGQNQAVAISRLGSTVKMIGAVGDDENGRWIKKELEKDAVSCEGVSFKSISTGIAQIYLSQEGKNNIVVYSGANFELSIEDIQNFEHLFDDAEFCVMQFEIPMEVIEYCLKYCKAKGIKTILNPAPAVDNFNKDYLKYIDYLIPNETELELLTKESLNDSNIDILAKKVLDMGCENLIVTLGDKGSKFYGNSESFEVKALKVEAVDTTAAGDSFIGGFVSALSTGNTIYEAMKFATQVSAIAVTRKGAINSMPSKKELMLK